jgi:hypothetical protein
MTGVRTNLFVVAPGCVELEAIKVVFARQVGKYFRYLDVLRVREFPLCPAR